MFYSIFVCVTMKCVNVKPDCENKFFMKTYEVIYCDVYSLDVK